MEIVDKKSRIDAEDMSYGQVYRITLDSATGVQETYIAMPMYNGNIEAKIKSSQILFIDLEDGGAFVVQYNEIIEVESLKAKLIIE